MTPIAVTTALFEPTGAAQRATDLAALLAARGVGNGDCVAVWLPSWADSYAWQFAASAVGAHVIGVVGGADKVAIARDLGDDAAFAHDEGPVGDADRAPPPCRPAPSR